MTKADYLEFEVEPIDFCLAYVNEFYSSKEYTSTKKGIAAANIHKNEFNWYLNDFRRKNLRPSTQLAAANLAPTSTASTQPLQSSLTPSSSTAAVKLTQENIISVQRRNDFLVKFYKLAGITEISDDFDNAFKKYILGLSTSDYSKFLESPIANCRAFVNQFYDLPFHKITNQSRQTAADDKSAFMFFLNDANEKKLEDINKLAAANLAPTSTASTQPLQSSSTSPVAKNAESEKTESSSEPDINTESDSDADNASSEKTEES